jgi:hypothetical protein
VIKECNPLQKVETKAKDINKRKNSKLYLYGSVCASADGQTDRQTERLTDRLTGRQTDRQAD